MLALGQNKGPVVWGNDLSRRLVMDYCSEIFQPKRRAKPKVVPVIPCRSLHRYIRADRTSVSLCEPRRPAGAGSATTSPLSIISAPGIDLGIFCLANRD